MYNSPLHLQFISKDNANQTLFTSLKFTMTSEELIILRNSLPTKYLDDLHRITGKSKTYIWQVLHEKRRSEVIVDAAIKLAAENKAREEERKNAITNL